MKTTPRPGHPTAHIALALVAGLTTAAPTLAEGITGQWTDGAVSVLVYDLPDGSYTGVLQRGGGNYPFTVAGVEDDAAIFGTFDAGGTTYPFSFEDLNGDGSATFQAGKAGFTVERKTWDGFVPLSELIQSGDHAAVWEILRPLVDAGQVHATYVAGIMVSNGHGVPADPARALELYQKAADAGSPNAMNNVGVAYRDGKGVRVDLKRALMCFEEGALRGDAMGALNAGAAHYRGEGADASEINGYAWSSLSGLDGARQNMQIAIDNLSDADLNRAMEKAQALQARRDDRSNAGQAGQAPGGLPLAFTLQGNQVVVANANGVEHILPGDVLVLIDHQPVRGMTLEQVQGLVSGPKDAMISLELKRGNGTVQLAMPRE